MGTSVKPNCFKHPFRNSLLRDNFDSLDTKRVGSTARCKFRSWHAVSVTLMTSLCSQIISDIGSQGKVSTAATLSSLICEITYPPLDSLLLYSFTRDHSHHLAQVQHARLSAVSVVHDVVNLTASTSSLGHRGASSTCSKAGCCTRSRGLNRATSTELSGSRGRFTLRSTVCCCTRPREVQGYRLLDRNSTQLSRYPPCPGAPGCPHSAPP